MDQPQEVLQWRSTSFSILLSRPKYALDVYNALNGSSYDNPNDVEIIKVESGISLSVENDATFLVFSFLNLYEHQSTPNPNMPLRFLIYVGKIYKQLAKSKNIYSTTKIYIPEPNFVVFYNGNREDYYPERSIQKLSDAYISKSEHPALELECMVLNINAGHNENLKEISEAIRGYSIYTQKVKDGVANKLDAETSIRKAIKECVNEGVLSEFFKEYGEMIVSADVWDCTFEKQIEMERRDFYAAGVSDGISQGEDRMRKLIKLLIKDGRDTEIPKASENTSYYENLLREYNIK